MSVKTLFMLGSAAVTMALAACGGDGAGSGGAGGSGGSDTTTSSSATTTSSSSTTSSTTTSSSSSGTGGGMPTMANVRVVHAAPDAPAVDFCVKGSSAATFTGPALNVLLNVAAGLAYPQVTEYLALPEDTYTVRLVAPGQTGCDTPLGGLPDVTGLAVKAGQSYSVAALGMLTPPSGAKAFQVKAFADDASVTAGQIKLRFIHASADTPNVDVGLGSGAMFTPVFTNVAFGDAGLAGGNAYLEAPPLSKATISARATGTTADALVLNAVDVPANAIVTAFAIGNLGGSPKALKALVCVDNAPAVNHLAVCTPLP